MKQLLNRIEETLNAITEHQCRTCLGQTQGFACTCDAWMRGRAQAQLSEVRIALCDGWKEGKGFLGESQDQPCFHKAQLIELIHAFRKYGNHIGDCPCFSRDTLGSKYCTCGHDNILAFTDIIS